MKLRTYMMNLCCLLLLLKGEFFISLCCSGIDSPIHILIYSLIFLIYRLEKPRMSLVLWKPKEEILKVKEEKEQEKEQECSKKRNGLLVAEPGMDVEM